jgi:3-dehydroquinate synthase
MAAHPVNKNGRAASNISHLQDMACIERTIQVSYRHRVYFTRGVFNASNDLLKQVLALERSGAAARALVVLDESLADAQPGLVANIESYFNRHSAELKLVCTPMVIEGGERTKNSYFHVSEIQSQVEKHHIDRHSYVIAVGGGALLDMAGLAAATAHRGVRHVRIPTTTLSQDDSGVGVKNGINAFGKKNFIGTFAPPFAVINDFDLLSSLPPRDKRAGFVEAVKVALIRDSAFFNEIERTADKLAVFDPEAMQRLIFRCAELHMNHIAASGDPFEFGSARPLDFGHWAAHKLEQISEYRIRHGEAVAIGIALDVIYSRRLGFLDAVSAERILSLLEKLGFELFANELLHEDSSGALVVLKGLEEFREHLGGQLTITLLQGVGRGFEVHEMDATGVLACINELQERQKQTASSLAARA